jgi:hypothetical protein
VVDGVPLCQLAQMLRAQAEVWSEPNPTNMRVGLGTDHMANAARNWNGMNYDYGSDTPVYVLAADGHFACLPPKCVASHPVVFSPPTTAPDDSTSSSTEPPDEVDTVFFSVSRADIHRWVGSAGVARHFDLSAFPTVYSLDGY